MRIALEGAEKAAKGAAEVEKNIRDLGKATQKDVDARALTILDRALQKAKKSSRETAAAVRSITDQKAGGSLDRRWRSWRPARRRRRRKRRG